MTSIPVVRVPSRINEYRIDKLRRLLTRRVASLVLKAEPAGKKTPEQYVEEAHRRMREAGEDPEREVFAAPVDVERAIESDDGVDWAEVARDDREEW